jgi:3-hydroxyisobutyrate dehydrogenase-like beta-hydroxyacid dehydrogenase
VSRGDNGLTTRFAFIGFGEFATQLAAGLRKAGVGEVFAYARPRSERTAAEALQRRMRAAGVRGCESLEQAVRIADVVIAAVPAQAAADVAMRAARAVGAGALYIDPAPLQPSEKEAAAGLIASAGADYVDVAVLGTVTTTGFRVPMLAAGTGARRWSQLAVGLGMNVSVVEGPPGTASLVKLLRSVFMKGRDALLLEMLLAARRYELDRVVMDSIGVGDENVPFPKLAERVLGSLALYAERRADELAASAEVEARVGVSPLMARAAEERLRQLVRLGLREHFHGERPESAEEVLVALDELADDL